MLTRWDPFRDFDTLFRAGTQGGIGGMDAFRRGDEIVVELDLPGVDRDSLDVTVESDVLEISARRAAHFEEGDQLIVAERQHGDVRRRLHLGESLDAERIEASYDDGVLRVVIPVAEEAKPRRIEIGGPAKKEVGAGS